MGWLCGKNFSENLLKKKFKKETSSLSPRENKGVSGSRKQLVQVVDY